MQLLLSLGVEYDTVNAYGNTPLHIACLNGQDLVAQELLRAGSSINAVNHKGQVVRLFIMLITTNSSCDF